MSPIASDTFAGSANSTLTGLLLLIIPIGGNGMDRNHRLSVHKTVIKFKISLLCIELLSCYMFQSYTRIAIRLANYEIS
jgi:hypothetical protein